ncbi:expressed unknown protein [Seminavis robusta]|uniref:Rad60/SUMO-like domain-containing protein n=1 Tax=Seminavis robusta TaxID=568900 RepID=A0A9N8HXQ1_9STRA|nr:expressed unknown protein [Seminavis robusta]|eukprot:Sro2539_g330570.1 n/a (411) ;mRNA; r:3078-4310
MPHQQVTDYSLDLPESLRERCLRYYGWDDAFTKKALRGYRQFMQLKMQLEDWHAEILSPSPTIDAVWLQHIVDVEQYVNACLDYCDNLIGHNPDDDLDNSGARKERIRTTMRSLKLVFARDIDREVWSFGDMNLDDEFSPRNVMSGHLDDHDQNNNKQDGWIKSRPSARDDDDDRSTSRGRGDQSRQYVSDEEEQTEDVVNRREKHSRQRRSRHHDSDDEAVGEKRTSRSHSKQPSPRSPRVRSPRMRSPRRRVDSREEQEAENDKSAYWNAAKMTSRRSRDNHSNDDDDEGKPAISPTKRYHGSFDQFDEGDECQWPISASEMAETQNKKVTIQVRDQRNGDIQRFRIRRNRKLVKLFKAYTEANRLSMEKCRFFYKSERITSEKTVLSVGLHHDAMIDMVMDKRRIFS